MRRHADLPHLRMLLLKVPVPLLCSSALCSALYLLRYVVIDGTFSRQPDAAFWALSSLATLPPPSPHLRNQVICPRPPRWLPAVAPRSVTSAGCSLQKESKSRRPPLPCCLDLLYQTLSQTTNGNARGSLPRFSRRGGFAASLAFLLPCTWLGARKVSHRGVRETFGAARNLGLLLGRPCGGFERELDCHVRVASATSPLGPLGVIIPFGHFRGK
jgi:hypothetical protein